MDTSESGVQISTEKSVLKAMGKKIKINVVRVTG